MNINRRKFIKNSGNGILGLSVISLLTNDMAMASPSADLFFKISLAEWSLNKTLFSGKLTNMEFPAKAKNDFGIYAVEYVNQFFKDKAEDETYLNELKSRTSDLGVKNVLIMIDGEGHLADSDDAKRTKSIENHYKWVEAAKFLGCHSIRVNAYATSKDPEEGKIAAIDGLSRLTDFAKPYGINIIVENHGGFSSNGIWLTDVIKQVSKPTCGTLPDFGNFCITRGPGGCTEEYDKYKDLEFDKIPLKICGGMETWEDVLRAQNAGGNVPVQIGYGMFKDPYSATVKTNYGLSKFCRDNGINSLNGFLDFSYNICDKYPVKLN